ncbi:terminase small subunit [Salmonella phage 19]|nr:terminase small subunit [Salmonella phage 19]
MYGFMIMAGHIIYLTRHKKIASLTGRQKKLPQDENACNVYESAYTLGKGVTIRTCMTK